jgi:hypothetical protein
MLTPTPETTSAGTGPKTRESMAFERLSPNRYREAGGTLVAAKGWINIPPR